jgi:glucose/arabinose dehydrogenase
VVGEERLIEELVGRIRDVRTGPNGYVYLVNDTPRAVLPARTSLRAHDASTTAPRS